MNQLALFTWFVIWLENFKLLSKIMLRSFSFSMNSNLYVYDRLGPTSNMSLYQLVQCALLYILRYWILTDHLSDHSIRWSMSLCSSWWQTAENNTWRSFVSSANINNFANISLGKSFINNINKTGPKTLPFGTPLMTDAQSDTFVGPYYAGPKWRYFLWYGVKRAGIVCLSMRVWLRTFEK